MPRDTTLEDTTLPRIYAWFSGLLAADTALLDELLAHGVPIDVPHPLRHSTALMEATRRGRADLVQWLLERGAAPAFLSGLPLGTPLHCAIRLRHWPVAEMLVEAMPSTSIRDAYGCTALHLLSMEPHSPNESSAILALAEKIIARNCPLDARNQDGITALHHCVINDMGALAELLLSHRADANAAVPETGVTPLIIAALEKNMAMAELLIHYGADPYASTREGTRAATIMPAMLRIVMRTAHS